MHHGLITCLSFAGCHRRITAENHTRRWVVVVKKFYRNRNLAGMTRMSDNKIKVPQDDTDRDVAYQASTLFPAEV